MIPAVLLSFILFMASQSQHPDYEVGFYSSVGECAANQLYWDDVEALCLDPSVRWEYREPALEKCLRANNDETCDVTWELCLDAR